MDAFEFKKRVKDGPSGFITNIADSLNLTVTEFSFIISGNFTITNDLKFNKEDNFDKEVIFDGGTFNNIIFTGGRYKKIIFRRGTFNGYISIRGGTFDNIVLLGGTFNHWLGTLDGINCQENGIKLAEERLEIRKLVIEGGTYTNNIWICGGEITQLLLKVVSTVKIHIKPNKENIVNENFSAHIKKNNSIAQISSLIFSGYCNKDSIIQISEVQLNYLVFEYYINVGVINFSNIELLKDVCFINSDLGKTTFIDCDFFDNNLKFKSSRITEIALAGSRLPKPENIFPFLEKQGNTKNEQRRLSLSQLKKVFESRGDTIEAAKYQAEELNMYYADLNLGFEKVNLGLNKYTNNHGQNWGRPLLLLISFGIFFYTIFCLSLGVTFDFSVTGLKEFGRLACYFFEFINPIRKSDFLPKEILQPVGEPKIPALAFLVDNLSKIFTAYLVYQLIAAFRKHGKKSGS